MGLAATSPAVYDEIRYDEKTKSGFVILPSRWRLRNYKNYIRPHQEFNEDVINELKYSFQFLKYLMIYYFINGRDESSGKFGLGPTHRWP